MILLRRLAAIPLLALLIAACSAPAPSTSQAPSPYPIHAAPSGGLALPAFTPVIRDPNIPVACAGIGLQQAILHGDPADPALAWLDVGPVPRRVAVVWPPGYAAVFNPQLEILDPAGNVVLREGDQIEGACVTGDPNVLLLEPPFEVASPPPVVTPSVAPVQSPPLGSPTPANVDCWNVAPDDCLVVVTASAAAGLVQPYVRGRSERSDDADHHDPAWRALHDQAHAGLIAIRSRVGQRRR